MKSEVERNKYEAVIGLEIHAELKTASKMFCSCANDPFNAEANANVCPICMGFPGTLPAPNKRAIELTLKVGKALGCNAAKESKFDRKNYFYPDLPKGYQISQYDLPLMEGGKMTVEGLPASLAGKRGGQGTTVRIRRVHLEEDTGKNIHPLVGGKYVNHSLVDYNRAGVPLIEMVTEPDITSPKLASGVAKELQQILRSQNASDADMEKGKMRVEANISIRKEGSKEFGTKVEVKNLNSFRSVEDAITYELSRQKKILEEGGKITQETRGWSEQKQETFSQRTKEEAEDYRYFPEPDIPPLAVSDWKTETAELPEERRKRYLEEDKLTDKMATVLVSNKAQADRFDRARKQIKSMPPATSANWLINEDIPADVEESVLFDMLERVGKGEVTAYLAKQAIKNAKETGKLELPEGKQVISDHGELATIIDEILSKNSAAVADVKAGKAQAMGFLVGQVMAKTKGQADPKTVNNLLQKKLQ